MKKVILFHPRTFHQKNYKFYWIPYSILSVGSELKREGYQVRLIDNNLETLNEKQFDEILRPYQSEDMVFVGISSMIGHQIKEGLSFANKVRNLMPSVPLVWGGPAATILSEDFINSPLVDVVVRRQGERTSVELTNSLSKNGNLESVLGIWFKNGEKILKNLDREILPKNKFARYDYNLVQTARYLREDEHIGNKVLNHISSQGCPFGCGFCSEVALYDRKWNSESLERMMQEVRELVETYGADGIKFYDANFFVNKNRALSFASEVKKNGWNIKWAASAHPKNLLVLDNDNLRTISESGCSRILIGAESGNNEELRYINKNMTTENVLEVARRLGNVGIHGSFTLIVGYPGFPEDNISKTLDFGRKIASISPLHEVKAHVYAPYPGTPLYQDAIKYGFVAPKTLEDWANYDYYEVQTPWLKSEVTKEVRSFNKLYCPYVL